MYGLKEKSQDLYQAHSTRDERPRCSSTPELEEALGVICLYLCMSVMNILRLGLGRIR